MKYQVRVGKDSWETCKKAAPTGKPGWLHYELTDGTMGLVYNNPNSAEIKWREKPRKISIVVTDTQHTK